MSIRSDKWFIKNFNNNCKYTVTHITDISFREVMSAEEILFGFNFKWDYHSSNKIKFKDKYQLNLELAKLHGYSVFDNITIGNYVFNISKEELMKGVIYPFVINSINTNDQGLKIPSKGLSSYGYDISLGRNFKIFSPDVFGNFEPYDPILKPDLLPEYVEETDVDFIILPPLTFALGHSVEHICVPKDHSVVCMAKSTLARWACSISVTPLEAGWNGIVTLEIFNQSNQPFVLRSGVGAMQMQFFEGDEACAISYSDRKGKYMNQGLTPVLGKV